MKYYLSGIAGAGMNAIAQYLLETGHEVVGSDRCFDRGESLEYKVFLESKGALIVPQDGKLPDASVNTAIFSAAVEQDVPDMKKAGELNIPVITRSLFLKDIFNTHMSIGIAGTSGKTTTTGMLAVICKETGKDATVFCGAEVLNYSSEGIGGNFFLGSSPLLVSEVDESDKLINAYQPKTAVVTNISEDHMSVEQAEGLFLQYMQNSEKVIYNGDCSVTNKLAMKANKPVFSFSMKDASADIYAEDIKTGKEGSSFSVSGVSFHIRTPGQYNVENALAAIAAARHIDIPFPDIARALKEYKGVAARFEEIEGSISPKVIYDFAHNPAKMDSLLANATAIFSSIAIYYQPHGFSPFKKHFPHLLSSFKNRLRDQDVLIIGKIYDAGGTAERNISSRQLVNELHSSSFRSYYAENRQEAMKYLLNSKKLEALFIVGARDRTLRSLAAELASSLPQ